MARVLRGLRIAGQHDFQGLRQKCADAGRFIPSYALGGNPAAGHGSRPCHGHTGQAHRLLPRLPLPNRVTGQKRALHSQRTGTEQPAEAVFRGQPFDIRHAAMRVIGDNKGLMPSGSEVMLCRSYKSRRPSCRRFHFAAAFRQGAYRAHPLRKVYVQRGLTRIAPDREQES